MGSGDRKREVRNNENRGRDLPVDIEKQERVGSKDYEYRCGGSKPYGAG